MSFATIGAVWFAHTVITEYLDHADSVLIRLNLLLLLVVSFLPFPTKLLAEYVHESDAERIAATVYGINLLLALVMVSVTWRYAVREHLVNPELADEDVKTLTKRLTPTLGVYVVMILVGLFLPLRPLSATSCSRSSSSSRSAPSGIDRATPEQLLVARTLIGMSVRLDFQARRARGNRTRPVSAVPGTRLNFADSSHRLNLTAVALTVCQRSRYAVLNAAWSGVGPQRGRSGRR